MYTDIFRFPVARLLLTLIAEWNPLPQLLSFPPVQNNPLVGNPSTTYLTAVVDAGTSINNLTRHHTVEVVR
jgi:hypothetical protein